MTIKNTISLLIIGLLVFGCSPKENGGVQTGKKKPAVTDDSKPKDAGVTEPTDDYEKKCGIKLDSSTSADAILFSIRLKSLPIKVHQEKLGLKVDVVATATAMIESKKSSSTQSTNLVINSVKVDGGSPLLKTLGTLIANGKAKEMAKEQSGPTEGTGMAIAEWLNLTSTPGQFEGLECGIPPLQKSSRDLMGGDEGHVEFVPGLPAAVNPKASRETIENEVGTGRMFNVTANYIKSKKDWPTGSQPGTVSIQPATPTFKDSEGRSHSSDLAYDIKVVFAPKAGKKEAPAFATHRTMYINTSTKDIDAIVVHPRMDKEGNMTPTIYLFKE